MEEEASLFELDSEELLKRKIKFYQQKIKSYKAIIKQVEDQLKSIAQRPVMEPSETPRRGKLIVDELDYSTTSWKPRVFNFLFENPAKYTTDQILTGIDEGKIFTHHESRLKAIRAISSSLFQLHRSGKIDKHENQGRRGYKWSIKEPVPNQMTGTG